MNGPPVPPLLCRAAPWGWRGEGQQAGLQSSLGVELRLNQWTENRLRKPKAARSGKGNKHAVFSLLFLDLATMGFLSFLRGKSSVTGRPPGAWRRLPGWFRTQAGLAESTARTAGRNWEVTLPPLPRAGGIYKSNETSVCERTQQVFLWACYAYGTGLSDDKESQPINQPNN